MQRCRDSDWVATASRHDSSRDSKKRIVAMLQCIESCRGRVRDSEKMTTRVVVVMFFSTESRHYRDSGRQKIKIKKNTKTTEFTLFVVILQ